MDVSPPDQLRQRERSLPVRRRRRVLLAGFNLTCDRTRGRLLIGGGRSSTIDVLEISLANSTVGVMDIAASWRREYHHPPPTAHGTREPRRQRKEPASGSGSRSPRCFPRDHACPAASSPTPSQPPRRLLSSARHRRAVIALPAPQVAHSRGNCSLTHMTSKHKDVPTHAAGDRLDARPTGAASPLGSAETRDRVHSVRLMLVVPAAPEAIRDRTRPASPMAAASNTPTQPSSLAGSCTGAGDSLMEIDKQAPSTCPLGTIDHKAHSQCFCCFCGDAFFYPFQQGGREED